MGEMKLPFTHNKKVLWASYKYPSFLCLKHLFGMQQLKYSGNKSNSERKPPPFAKFRSLIKRHPYDLGFLLSNTEDATPRDEWIWF